MVHYAAEPEIQRYKRKLLNKAELELLRSLPACGLVSCSKQPLAHSISPEMGYVVASTSAVLTGAIFGDHCSPISDTTILSSMGAGCNHIDHVKTQMPYSLFIASIAILFGYIPAGMGLPAIVVLPVALLAVVLGLRIFGKRTDVDDKTFEADRKSVV